MRQVYHSFFHSGGFVGVKGADKGSMELLSEVRQIKKRVSAVEREIRELRIKEGKTIERIHAGANKKAHALTTKAYFLRKKIQELQKHCSHEKRTLARSSVAWTCNLCEHYEPDYEAEERLQQEYGRYAHM